MSQNLQHGQKIRDIILSNVVKKLKRGEVPTLSLPVRTSENIVITKDMITLGDKVAVRRLDNVKELRPFAQLMSVAEAIYTNVLAGKHPSVRDIFYNVQHTIPGTNTNLFADQTESNKMVEEIELLTGLSREELGIVAEAKGQIAGEIEFEGFVRGKLKSVNVADLPMPGSIPPLVDDIKIKSINAKYVLIVEKGAVFGSLYEDGYWEKENCLLITAGGQPDRATRRMVSRLEKEFKLPIYVLTDSDPYGLYIFSVYKMGSIQLAYENKRLAATTAKFVGITPSDVYNYKIPQTAIIKATNADIKRAMDIKKYPWFQTPEWTRELDLFLAKKDKVEIEAFSKHGFDYLEEKYLPDKINGGKML